MNATEFLTAVARDEASGGRKDVCGHPLGPRVDGEHYQIEGVGEVCEDCYFDAVSAEIDNHPIGRGRPHGRAH